MDYATVVDQAVKQFYAQGNNEVHTWLLQIQASPEAWTFVWELLDPSKVRKLSVYLCYSEQCFITTIPIPVAVLGSAVVRSHYFVYQDFKTMERSA